MREIDARRGLESLVTLLASVWELPRKEYRRAVSPPFPLLGVGLEQVLSFAGCSASYSHLVGHDAAPHRDFLMMDLRVT